MESSSVIIELREELQKAVNNKDLKQSVDICKRIGISLRQLCRLSGVNVGNTSAYLKGYSVGFTKNQEEKLFRVMEQFV